MSYELVAGKVVSHCFLEESHDALNCVWEDMAVMLEMSEQVGASSPYPADALNKH